MKKESITKKMLTCISMTAFLQIGLILEKDVYAMMKDENCDVADKLIKRPLLISSTIMKDIFLGKFDEEKIDFLNKNCSESIKPREQYELKNVVSRLLSYQFYSNINNSENFKISLRKIDLLSERFNKNSLSFVTNYLIQQELNELH